jgi:TetR/AcrR family transcriptional regulator, cholesterol catabolism regulator
MDKSIGQFMEKARDLSFTFGIRSMSLEEIRSKLNISKPVFNKHFKSKNEFISKLLEFERESFKSIFDDYNFEGVNAIDILLTVGEEVAMRFKDVNPSLTHELHKYYPELYQHHFDARQQFIFEKIKINLTKGIDQGVYRKDLSIELVARLYMSRLIDLHNPEFFPPEQFSFDTLFHFMFDQLIRGIANKEGLKHYEEKTEKHKSN